jgi:hypothetical protein
METLPLSASDRDILDLVARWVELLSSSRK